MDVRADVAVDRPASEVFQYLADGENMPRWMKDFTAVEKVGDAPIGPGTEFRYHDKRGTDSTFAWSDYRPPGRLAWHGAEVKMPGGSVVPDGYYDIHEHDGHTHIEMHMTPRLQGMAKLMAPLMSMGMRRSSKQYIQLLKDDIEKMSTVGRVARRFGYRGWQQFTQLHVRAYRATGGRLGKTYKGAPVLLLDHVGRKSGRHMTSPLIYGEDGDDLILVASFGGAPRDPFWWPNLKAHPDTKVNVYGDVRPVRARQATPEEKARIWPKMVEVYAPYADYQRKTERDIPVVILEPA